MRIKIVTSEKSVSLFKIAKDVADVFSENGITVSGFVQGPYTDSAIYQSVDGVAVVMTFDPFWAVPYFFVCWLRRYEGKKCVFYTTIEGRPILSSAYEWVRRDLTFVANSNYTKRMLEQAEVRVDGVVYHGIDLGLATVGKSYENIIRARLGIPRESAENKFFLGYIAGCYTRKGHALFSDVIKMVFDKDRSIYFVIITTPDCLDYYKLPHVRAYPLFGQLQEYEVFAFYNIIDAYIHPALAEGFGMPVLEALSCGKPVIHMDYEPLSEITTLDVSVRIPVIGTTWVREGTGIDYEFHFYNPADLVEAIVFAKDWLKKNKDDITAKCVERAKQFDKHKVYKQLITYIR